jgi:hypothetical protein
MDNGSMYRPQRCTGRGTAPQPWPSAGGTDLKTGQDQLGHSTITLTAATCTSVLPKTARAAANTPALLVPRQPRARHGSKTRGQPGAQAASSAMDAAGPQKVPPRGVTPARDRHPGGGVRYPPICRQIGFLTARGQVIPIWQFCVVLTLSHGGDDAG